MQHLTSFLFFSDYIASVSSSGELIMWETKEKKKVLSFKMQAPHNKVLSAVSLDQQSICCCKSV